MALKVQGLVFGFGGSPRPPPNYPLIYHKYTLFRAIRTLLKGLWEVLGNLEGFRVPGCGASGAWELPGLHGLRV